MHRTLQTYALRATRSGGFVRRIAVKPCYSALAARSMSSSNGGKDEGNSWGSWFGGKPDVPVAIDANKNAFDVDSFKEPIPVDTPEHTTSAADALSQFNSAYNANNTLTSTGVDGTASIVTAGASAVEEAAKVVEPLSMMNPGHLMMQVIENIHLGSFGNELPYFQSILVMTAAIRLFLFPIAVAGMKNAVKMQHLKPVMDEVNARMIADPNRVENKPQYDEEVKAIFAKHEVNPFKSLVVPIVQIPVFMSMFFALRNMGDYFPDFANGGTKWFVDLTAADPTMAMPVVNACLFLTLIQIGGENNDMNTQNPQMTMMKNVFRGMGVLMVPLTLHMPAGLFVYWIGNGSISIIHN